MVFNDCKYNKFVFKNIMEKWSIHNIFKSIQNYLKF